MTLAEMMRQERFPVPLTLSILRRCARQLDAAHESGLIHGGLTPSQILIAGRGDEQTIQVEVKEYGGPRQQQENLVIGLAVPDFAPYMSPEEILGTPIDRRSDEFYLAVIAYELFCG